MYPVLATLIFNFISCCTPPSRLSPVRLSPDFQDLSKRVRLSPAFFAYHFQDLTKQDLTEQDLIKFDLMINFKISKSLNHNQFKARPYRFKEFYVVLNCAKSMWL